MKEAPEYKNVISLLKSLKAMIKVMRNIDTVDGFQKHLPELDTLTDKLIESMK